MLELILGGIIFVCCISICFLVAYVLDSIKEQKQYYKEQETDHLQKLLQCQRDETYQAIELYEIYKKEIDRLKEQIQELEKEETEELKSQPSKIWSDEMKYNGIYEGKKALIGNYDNFSADMTRKILRNFGLSVERVKTSTDLLEKAKINHYDIIFTNNIYQQGVDGPTLLKQLRELEGFNTPVVIHTISANQRYHFVDDLGFDEYIEKPIKIADIERVLKKFL
ncbi:MAG: response regulator [Clostridia bacterium]|nr:response regulator [Clostridia bacterium]